MNNNQQKILIKTSWVIALMLAFPPYSIKNVKGVIIQSGYDFILDLPSKYLTSGFVIASELNVRSLIAQVFVVIIISGLLFFAKKDKQ
jgi:hypothetical protein